MPASDPPYRVALIGDRMRPNTFQFMRGVLDFIQETEHWQILGDRVDPLHVPDDLDLAQVDGAIGMFTEQRWVDQVVEAGVAAVNMSVSLADSRLPRVSIDDRAIGHMGASYLLERGLPHLGFVSMGDPGWYVGRRREGFVETVEQQSDRRCFVEDASAQDTERDPTGFVSWFDALPKPIGIMACNDAVACRAIEVVERLGLRIPDDVAILGVDNDMFTAQLMTPQLSSVDPNNRLAGYQAAKLLDGLMAGEKHPPTRWIRPIGVVSRQSTDVVMSQDPLVSRGAGVHPSQLRQRHHGGRCPR
jgi:LacI family transcriptional regulator